MLPIAADIAARLTRKEALSARPDAPVIDYTPSPTRGRSRRLQLAQILRKLADRLEPAQAPPPTSP